MGYYQVQFGQGNFTQSHTSVDMQVIWSWIANEGIFREGAAGLHDSDCEKRKS